MKEKNNLYTTPVLDSTKLGRYTYSLHNKGFFEKILDSRIVWNIFWTIILGGMIIVSIFKKIASLAKTKKRIEVK